MSHKIKNRFHNIDSKCHNIDYVGTWAKNLGWLEQFDLLCILIAQSKLTKVKIILHIYPFHNKYAILYKVGAILQKVETLEFIIHFQYNWFHFQTFTQNRTNSSQGLIHLSMFDDCQTCILRNNGTLFIQFVVTFTLIKHVLNLKKNLSCTFALLCSYSFIASSIFS